MGRLQPSNRTIIGVALLLFGSVLLGVGIHHVVKTGTCSSTGYSSHYGPVPYCPKGEGWWILFIIGGILLSVVGGLMSGGPSAGLIIPAVFAGIGIGSLTIAFDAHAASGTKTFGAVFGGAFAFFGLIPALLLGAAGLRGLSRSRPPASAFASPPATDDAIMGAYASAPATGPARVALAPPSAVGVTAPLAIGGLAAASSATPGGDALDKIAKLSELHDKGALTDDEFSREKAKLLAEL